MWFWLFCASLVLNLFLMLYVRWLFKTMEEINNFASSLLEKVTDFSRHLGEIHEMEMFYGDKTLQDLLQHASQLSKDIMDLDLVFNDPIEEEDDDATPGT